MAVRVVHVFKAVQVDEDDGCDRAGALGRGDRALRTGLELLFLQQAGTRVVDGQAPQLFFPLALAGHVPQSEHEAAYGGGSAQVAAVDLDVHGLPIPAGDLPYPLQSRVGRVAAEHVVHGPGDVGAGLVADKVRQLRSDDRSRAEQRSGGWGGVADCAVLVEDDDYVRVALEQCLEEGLAWAGRTAGIGLRWLH